MRNRILNFILWLALLQLAQLPVAAQTPATTVPEQLMRSQPVVDISAPVTATASFDPPFVRPGEKSVYHVTFTTSEASVRLPEQIAAPPQLNLHRSASGQGYQAAGGTIQIVATFNYEAQATEQGLFTVPGYTVDIYGQPVAVPAARLQVRTALPEPHEPLRRLLLIPSATNVFEGESFNVRVLLPATPPNGAEIVQQTQINGDGFIADKNSMKQSIQPVEINGGNVSTYIYETSVLPIATGPLQLSAQGFTAGMQFGGPIIISGQVSIPGGPPKYLLLESEPATINVRPLPTESELPGFTGAVGSYTCDPPSLTTNVLKVGEPVQLTVVVRGQENLNRVNPPPPPRAQGWQVFPAMRDNTTAVVGTNRPGAGFKYTLIPISDEVRATPAIPFSCFDPATGKYMDLTIPSLPVTVIADKTLTNAETALMLSENPSEPEKKTGLSLLAKTPGYTAHSLVPLQMRAWFPFVQLLPALGFCGLWFWDRRRRFLEQHPEIVRRRQARRALRRELRRLEQSAASNDDASFVRCAINALQIASAPHYPATPRALVCGDVLQTLTVAGTRWKKWRNGAPLFCRCRCRRFRRQSRKQHRPNRRETRFERNSHETGGAPVNFKIKTFLILILSLTAASQGRAAGEAHFREGVTAYEAGQFDRAAQAFRVSLAEQTAAGTLLNLGLAEWRDGHPGEAVIAWEQSAWLNPFNPDTRNNLLYAEEMIQVNAPELTICERISTWLPAGYWTWIAGGSLWLAVAMVTLPGFFRWRKAGWHQSLAALASGIFLLSIPPNIGVFTRAELGIVTEKNTPLRLTPTQSAEMVASLSAGEPIRRLRARGDYLFVHTPYGNGWIGRHVIKISMPSCFAFRSSSSQPLNAAIHVHVVLFFFYCHNEVAGILCA